MSDSGNSRNQDNACSFPEFENVSEADWDLVDRFLSNQSNDEEAKQLEVRLKNDPLLRAFFVCYSSFFSDLQMSARGQFAGESALQKVFDRQTEGNQRSTNSAVKIDESEDSTSKGVGFNGLVNGEVTVAPEDF